MFPKKNCPLFHHLRYMQLFSFSVEWWQSWKNEKKSVLIPHNLPKHQILWAASLLEVSLLRLPLLLSNYLNNPFCFSNFINHLFWGFILAANLGKFICRPENTHFLFALQAWYPISPQFNRMSKIEENNFSRHSARLNHISFTLM